MAKKTFEEIKPWDGTSGTGSEARLVIKENFDKVNDMIDDLPTEYVSVSDQDLTSEQKGKARENIGAFSSEYVVGELSNDSTKVLNLRGSLLIKKKIDSETLPIYSENYSDIELTKSENYIFNANGSLQANIDYETSEERSVANDILKTIYLDVDIRSAVQCGICWYNSDHSKLASALIGTGSTVQYRKYKLEHPEGAVYYRVSGLKDTLHLYEVSSRDVDIYKKNEVDNLISQYESSLSEQIGLKADISDVIDDTYNFTELTLIGRNLLKYNATYKTIANNAYLTNKNIADTSKLVSKFIDSNGDKQNGTPGLHYMIEGLLIYNCGRIVLSGSGVNRNVWLFYDMAGTKISFQNVISPVVPENAYSFDCYYGNSITGNVQIEVGTTASAFQEFTKTNLLADTYFKIVSGQTVVFTTETTVYEGAKVKDEVSVLKEKIKSNSVYGVKWLINSSESAIERIEDSIGLVANSAIGDSVVRNDFDIVFENVCKRCNIKTLASGAKKITYEGEVDFTLDGTNGDVFVEWKKIYFKSEIIDGYQYLYMSLMPRDGFYLDPVFVEKGKELNEVYIGCYELSKDTEVRSMSGTIPYTGKTISQFRTEIQSKGVGYSPFDIRTIMFIQKLYIVEFANFNSQNTIGQGQTGYSQPEFLIKTVNNANNTFTADYNFNDPWSGGHIEIPTFAVGMNLGFTKDRQTIFATRKLQSITSDGTTVTVVYEGDSLALDPLTDRWGGAFQDTGLTDDIVATSGKSIDLGGKPGKCSVKYRGIENLWGNVWHFVDGINFKSLVAYVNYKDSTTYADEKYDGDYKPSALDLPVQANNAYEGSPAETFFISKIGFDNSMKWFLYPSEFGTNGNTTKDSRFGDCYYLYNLDGYMPVHGGGFDHYYRCGLFTMRGWVNKLSFWYLQGSRLIYKNI